MNAVLHAWNTAPEAAAMEAMLACCGARRWAVEMVSLRPIQTVVELSEAADRVWDGMKEADWMEAIACHPRIGDRKPAHASAQSQSWSREEQAQAGAAGEDVLVRLARLNALYEERFGFTYIVCATGKSAEEMLAILERRLLSSREAELREAAEQQRQITQIRHGKWLIA